jgi:hypothetical protein
MSEIYAYGEDGLTLWALQAKLDKILSKLGDNSTRSSCKLFFRPSFGRRGGQKGAQFGEFDFIILAGDRLYLGESKWDSFSKAIRTKIELRMEQLIRHQLFVFYVNCAFERHFSKWDDFEWENFFKSVPFWVGRVGEREVNKPIAPTKSLLRKNLQEILKIIKGHFKEQPNIYNVLLYLYSDDKADEEIPREINGDFKIVPIKYHIGDLGNYIYIKFDFV